MDSGESQLKAELYRDLYDSLRKNDVERFILLVNKARKGARILNEFSKNLAYLYFLFFITLRLQRRLFEYIIIA